MLLDLMHIFYFPAHEEGKERRIGMAFPVDFDVISKFFDRDFLPKESFPKSRVYLTHDNTLVFEFALAGFRKEDISIELEDVYLKIIGKNQKLDETQIRKIFFNNLATRDFALSYLIPSNFARGKVKASFENSILKIEISKPEEELSKKILID